jgi:myo-inositol-1(or 4)-monophosphatase
MHPMLNIATSAARAAGDIVMRGFDQLTHTKVEEEARSHFVAEINRATERRIIEVLHNTYPDHSMVAKESGQHEGSGSDHQWIIDPIDGSLNFTHGFPHFSTAIALTIAGKVELAVIYDPLSHDLFTASRGRGAQLNSKRIRVTKQHDLGNTLLATGVQRTRSADQLTRHMNSINTLLPICADVRRSGCTSLDLAYVASGRLDGFWEEDLPLWNIAAGSLMVLEAGGLVSDFNGTENYLANGNIIASNPKLFKQLIQKCLS